ncbi:hypothetical protein [Halobacillus naozhouensis]|uniref:Pyrrolidone-carboxylate peptidase (N-terminal pyroglutamyl peptidase) n=1 Tax=Halobacillus naozhouensis TaxID=554880 RepID=A0ABY8IWI1_9BACI|nr:hypothetical protein [Halobacillus naozhouensis]WFT74101.1 hypothetical protein P9989_17270 [Halobacillus naozhouensis]
MVPKSRCLQKPAYKMLACLSFVSLVLLVFLPVKSYAKEKADCYDSSVPLTLEEQRITEGGPYAKEILHDSQFDQFVEKFEKQLCSAPNLTNAENIITKHGSQIWETAVARAQGERPNMGKLDQYDDRPLYWARLSMTKALRQWSPGFGVTDGQRQALIKQLEYTSRGITSVQFPKGNGVQRILVSGFDPYGFGTEYGARHSNPSGAIALQLDGLRVETDEGPAVVQAVNFPVRWKDFEQGIVEDAFGPYLQQLDLMMTISQGGPGDMEIEGYHGRWHVGTGNNGSWREGVIPTISDWPMPEELPEFIETTLPAEAMVEADTGPLPVKRDDHVCEWLAPEYKTEPYVCSDDGPASNSQARAGGGGSYLSNEVGYRSNRLRLGFGLEELPGGHLHVASLDYPEDPLAYIDEELKQQRRVIVDQGVELVKAAAKAIE